ncbi:MAG: hypothetical protein HKN80_05470 [Acidimicrobiia bacterium]|nr:hypothetical protein [Acidimicrobiia bacterium]
MQDLEERTSTEPVHESRRTGLVAMLAIIVLAAAAVVTWLLVRGGGEDTATDVIQEYAAAMRADDMESVAGFDADTAMGGFVEWQIALQAEPTFTDCTEIVGPRATSVTCVAAAGDEYFYTVIAGEQAITTVSGSVDEEGVLTGTSWPPPPRLQAIDADFRDWVKVTYPDLESRMWGGPVLGIKMTRESGELRMQLLDEYLAWR